MYTLQSNISLELLESFLELTFQAAATVHCILSANIDWCCGYIQNNHVIECVQLVPFKAV